MDLLTYPHDDKMKRLNVRERAILTVKYLCAQKPALVREIVPKYISALLSEGVPKVCVRLVLYRLLFLARIYQDC